MSVLVAFVVGLIFGIALKVIFTDYPSLSDFERWLEDNYHWGRVMGMQDRFDAARDLSADFRREDREEDF